MDIEHLRDRMLAGKYVVTDHAREEMRHGGFGTDELMSCIESGEIINQDWDADYGTEFLVEGRTSTRQAARVKVGIDDDDKVVSITVYPLRRRKAR